MRPIEQLLEERHTAKLAWNEPWNGRSVDGEFVSCHAEVHMTVHDCINFERATYAKERPELLSQLSDAQLLEEFITAYWAWEVGP